MPDEKMPYHEIFYLEIPQTQSDYLNDINLEAIEDVHDFSDNSDVPQRGLSAEQVTEIARDSLENAQPVSPDPTDSSQTLFSNKPTSTED